MKYRPSTYDSLPKEIQELIDSSLAMRMTLNQIVELVEAEGHEISRSSLDRYRRNRWLENEQRIKERNDRIHTLVEVLKTTPSPDLYGYIESELQVASLYDVLEGNLDPAKKAQIMIRLGDLRLKGGKLDLDKLKQELDEQRLALDRDRLEMQRRLNLLPGAIETWKLMLKFFAEKDPEILSKLQAYSEEIAKILEEYFEDAKGTAEPR